MPRVDEAQSPEDRTLESFAQDQIVFVDVLVVPPAQQGGKPVHKFRAGKYVTGDGDVACVSFDRCLLIFKLVWSPKHFKSAMFTKGPPDAPTGSGVPEQDWPALVIGVPGTDGCPERMATPPFHDVLRDTTGQMVSVINDNPGGPGKNQYAYKLNVLVTEHDRTQRLVCIDPRIINR
ncbi:hypothetical protein [Luteimonas mephitis]|uniref:hypothetical protein n=1 Tax=Luteimonas mephitis TaxID=83615 RepID=UPI003A8DACC2